MIEDEANEIANNAFGGDYEQACRVVDRYYMAAVACGCGQCKRVMMDVVRKYNRMFTPPNEDDITVRYDIVKFAPKVDDGWDETEYSYGGGA